MEGRDAVLDSRTARNGSRKSIEADGGGDGTDLAARLAAARALVERDFRRDLPLDDVARAAHFSAFHFHRLFRRRYGQTPKQLVIALRVAEVQRLALAGTSFKDAAAAAGFAHQSHMTVRFKRVLGVTPRKWLTAARAAAAATRN